MLATYAHARLLQNIHLEHQQFNRQLKMMERYWHASHATQQKHPKIIIIILNWNGKEDTVECIESVKKVTYSNYEILIVDNGSTDGSQEVFKQKYPDITLIENSENLGYAEGNNVGIRYALKMGTEYVLLLNNDTIVDASFLDELIKGVEIDRKVGIGGPKIYFYHEPKKIISVGVNLNLWTSKSSLIGYNQIDKGQFGGINKVAYVQGAAILVKKEVITEIGLLDPRFFCYYEETDWCARARRAGYSVVVVPNAKIWHKVSATAKKIKEFTLYYLTRNRFLFMKKNATKFQFISFLLYFFMIDFILITSSLIFRSKDLNLLKTFYGAIYDGIMFRTRANKHIKPLMTRT